MEITAYNIGIEENEENENKKTKRYKKIRFIAKGAFGSVFEAEDVNKKTFVAVKRVICKSLNEINDSLKEVSKLNWITF